MFVVLVGLAVHLTMSADQCQNMPLRIFAHGASAALRQPECVGEVEREVDWHQCVDGQRDETEQRGPASASPGQRLYSVNEGLEQSGADENPRLYLEKASGAPSRA